MASKHPTGFCRLCFKLKDRDFHAVEDVHKQALEILQIKLHLSMIRESVICETCWNKIKEYVSFKALFLYVDDYLIPYTMNAKANALDLKILFDDMNLENHEVCRICLKIVNIYMVLTSYDIEIIRKYIPEADLNITSAIIVCYECYNCLQDISHFASNHDSWEKLLLDYKYRYYKYQSKINLGKFLEYMKEQQNVVNVVNVENVQDETVVEQEDGSKLILKKYLVQKVPELETNDDPIFLNVSQLKS